MSEQHQSKGVAQVNRDSRTMRSRRTVFGGRAGTRIVVILICGGDIWTSHME